MGKLHHVEPEIREDLQGRIEVFDQSIRSFEKRLRAVERRLSLEAPPSLQAGRAFSEVFSGSFQDENSGDFAAGSSVSLRGLSVSPESSFPLPGNSLLSSSVQSIPEGEVSNPVSGALLSSTGSSNISMVFLDNSSEVSGNGSKIKEVNSLFLDLSENLRLLQESLSELSDFAHSTLEPEIKKMDVEIQNLISCKRVAEENAKRLDFRVEAVESQNRLNLGSIKVPVEISGVAGSSVLFLTGFLVWSGRWDVIRSPYFSIGLAVLMACAVLLKFYMVNRKQKSIAGME